MNGQKLTFWKGRPRKRKRLVALANSKLASGAAGNKQKKTAQNTVVCECSLGVVVRALLSKEARDFESKYCQSRFILR